MGTKSQPSIAVIGAGMAGLACARLLADKGVGVTVFEKSRRPGGRMATRRAGALQFDHGAQYVTARSDALRAYLNACITAGAAALWTPSGRTDETADWIVGAPGMSGLTRPLAHGLSIVHGVQIAVIIREGQGHALKAGDGARYGPFDGVIVTAPAPQTLKLLGPVDPAFAALDEVRMSPCWAVLAAFEGASGADADVLRQPSPAIAWAARDSSKPGRSQLRDVETWVLHASPVWSRAHLESDKAEIANLLACEFYALAPATLKPPPAYIDAHRWRYALVETPLWKQFVQGDDPCLIAAGDWCLGPRVEAAFDSGRAAAQAMLAGLSARSTT